MPFPVVDHASVAEGGVADDPLMGKLLVPQVLPSGPAYTTGKELTVSTMTSVTVATQGSML